MWTARDLPFGDVLVFPSAKALLLRRPENWDENAPKRNGASPDRIERTRYAGIELIPFRGHFRVPHARAEADTSTR